MARNKIEGLERLRRKLDRMPVAVKAAAMGALLHNQREFAGALAIVVPKGDPSDGNLVSSIETGHGDHELALTVSIGNEQFPYPAHLEFGHRAPDGSMVPAKPAFYPLLRVSRKKFDRRVMGAVRKAIKATAAGGG